MQQALTTYAEHYILHNLQRAAILRKINDQRKTRLRIFLELDWRGILGCRIQLGNWGIDTP